MTKYLCDLEGHATYAGDFVGFKDDIEQSGKAKAIKDGYLVISMWDSEAGERYDIEKPARQCWFEGKGPEREAAEKSAIADMVKQCQIGNTMIENGNNSTQDHIEAAEAATATDAEWAATYSGYTVGAKLSRCAALRAVAAGWTHGRKAFIDAAVKYGVNKGTAATQWQHGRKELK